MGKYQDLAKDIVKNVGGKENINSLTHCITRLRFILKDEGKANTDVLNKMDGVVTIMKSGGQYQVVIGNHVPEVYEDVCAVAGLGGGSSANAEPVKKKPVEAVMDFISGIFGSCISILCAGGIIQGLVSLAVTLGILSETSGLYQILYACGQSFFYFFPVFLGFSCFKKLGGNPYLGAMLGACMIYPDIQGVDLNLFGLTINATYTSTVLPIIFTSILGVWLEKFFNKHVPDVIKTFITPLLVIAICVPLGFAFIGIAANALSDGITNVIMAIYSFSPALAGAALGGLWQVLVIFGIHQGLVGVGITQLVTAGSTPIFSLQLPCTFVQTGVVIAIWAKTKDKKLKDVSLPAWISGIFGVTEPAIYGVTLPRIKYFVISCIVSAVAGAAIGMSGIVVSIMGGLGVFSLPSFFAQGMDQGIIMTVIVMAAAVVGFLVTFFMYKEDVEVDEAEFDQTDAQAEGQEKGRLIRIPSPMKGKMVNLEEVPDAAFAGGALGLGAAIEPEEGVIYSPVDGTAVTVFPTLHAIGIEADNGEQILMHVGLNTVELNGKGFKAYIQQGDRVKKGQKLLEFDIDEIKKAGYPVTTPVIVTNTPDYTDVLAEDVMELDDGDPFITIMA